VEKSSTARSCELAWTVFESTAGWEEVFCGMLLGVEVPIWSRMLWIELGRTDVGDGVLDMEPCGWAVVVPLPQLHDARVEAAAIITAATVTDRLRGLIFHSRL
jgi:hypothetical protein